MAIHLGMASTLSISRHILCPLHPDIAIHVRRFSLTSSSPDFLTNDSPESPRWLANRGLYDEARLAVAQTNANGDVTDPVVLTVYKEIIDTLRWEKEESRILTPMQIARNPTARKRLLIGASAGPFSCIAGNIIASYYLGAQLDTAGITDSLQQLKANVVLNVFCLGMSLLGTQLCAACKHNEVWKAQRLDLECLSYFPNV